MRVPVSWLQDYVDFDGSIEELSDMLTFSGTEVEGIEIVGGTFEGIVVGEVRSVKLHPNADRLSLCDVFDGDTVKEVVCGAPNVQAGGKYPFAPIGTTLPTGMKLKKAKIRGVESQGMLCAEDELGLSNDHGGLMELSESAKAGTPLAEILGPPETVLELEITPNRPDCLSMIGIAREMAAMMGKELKRPEVDFSEDGDEIDNLTSVTVHDKDLCPRYTARMLTDVKNGPSPEWMARRLTLAGIRPINLIVDITNYVLLECGHPLHAFDHSLLQGGRVIVRQAKKGEVMTTLDGIQRKLTPDMLVIADERGPVALAGIMGGAGSEIQPDTSTVFLESAYFQPEQIRKTARDLTISTESSYRFARGADIEGAEWASRRATALLQELAGATVAKGMIDAYPFPYKAPVIKSRSERIENLLGVDVPDYAPAKLFKQLGLEISEQSERECTVVVPSFRRDLAREVDLIEEYSRILGLDKIPTPTPGTKMIPGADDRDARAMASLRKSAVALGLQEIMNYSLTAPGLLDLLDPEAAKERVVMPHPISMDQSVLRTSLIPQLVDTLGHNRAYQIEEAAFFELGRVFSLQEKNPVEATHLAIGLMGPLQRAPFDRQRDLTAQEMFQWLRGILDALFSELGLSSWELGSHEKDPRFEAGQSQQIFINRKPVGVMGMIKQSIRTEWRINDPVAVAEMDATALITNLDKIRQVKDPAAYPPIERDIALVAPKSLKNSDILKIIEQNAPSELESVRLFDIFEGETIGAGRKSMAYSLTYRSSTRTLTDADANQYHEGVKEALRSHLDVTIRES